MSASHHRGGRAGGGSLRNQRTCPLSDCENIVQGRFIYCSKEHSRQAVDNGEAEACERCGVYPKNPGFEYCTRACGSAAAAGIPYTGNAAVTMSLWTMSVNPNAPAQPGGQPSSGRGQGQQNQARGNIGGGGRGAGRGGGRGRGRSRNDEDTSDRLSIRSGPSVKTIGSSGDRGLRTYYFDPCNCSVRTKVTPTTAYCPVCNAGCTQVFVEKDGKFIDFLAEDGAIDEEPSTEDAEDAEPPQPQSSVPQPAPSFSPPAQVAPSPPARVVPSPPAQVAPTSQLVILAPPSEDEGQQMIEVRNAQPASLMSRVTVRRLPNPPKPIGPRPAPDHSMDIDFPDGMDELEAQVESPTETRPVGTSGYGQESVQPPTKPVFRDEDSLPFARRGSPMPPHETRTAASPTSPVDPFVQSSSVDSYELEMEDMAPAPVTPSNHHLPPQNYTAPSPQANPFDDSAAAETSQPAPEAHPVVQEVVKENKSNSLPVPSQWEGFGASSSASLNRAPAFSASSGTQRPASDPVESSPYASESGNTALPNGGNSGFRYPEGGYELRGSSKPQSNQLHQRNNSDGLHSRNNSDNLHQRNNSDGPYGRTVQGGLQPPSSLLNPVDLPPPSPTSPGVNNNPPTSARWNPPPGPPPNHYLSAPNTTMPNGTGSGRRTPSPTRSRPTSATGTRPVKISEKQYEPHFGLSNLSYTPINYPDPNTALDKQYPTPEHLFQAMKFMGHKPLIAEHIRTCGGNPKPRDEARRFAYEQDPSWATTCLERMYEVLQLKFKSYPGLEAELLDTGEADLVLDSSDTFWGCGPDGRGENQLGSLLMRLRVELVEALSRQFDQSGLSN